MRTDEENEDKGVQVFGEETYLQDRSAAIKIYLGPKRGITGGTCGLCRS